MSAVGDFFSSLELYELILLAVGGVVAVVLFILLLCYCAMRRRRYSPDAADLHLAEIVGLGDPKRGKFAGRQESTGTFLRSINAKPSKQLKRVTVRSNGQDAPREGQQNPGFSGPPPARQVAPGIESLRRGDNIKPIVPLAKPSAKALKMMGISEEDAAQPYHKESVKERVARMAVRSSTRGYYNANASLAGMMSSIKLPARREATDNDKRPPTLVERVAEKKKNKPKPKGIQAFLQEEAEKEEKKKKEPQETGGVDEEHEDKQNERKDTIDDEL